ncbi:MAG: hypothetical protein EAX90_12135 [Candidatus Heimdallarchaeota archaeon]|nr:hypothetical protein [Candidatus Heimdallarchaeota archaeon]
MKFTCTICYSELISAEQKAKCSFCGVIEEAELICPNGHFHCEECRLSDAEEIVYRICSNSSLTNPVEIVNLIMHHPTFHTHGVEHHLVVAPAILTALFNTNKISLAKDKLQLAIQRVIDIPMGACGSRGDCGASTGAGIVISLILKASFRSDKERPLVLEATGQALFDLAKKGGRRCCKQSVYSTIETTYHFLQEKQIVSVSPPFIKCEFKGMEECKKEQCEYFER